MNAPEAPATARDDEEWSPDWRGWMGEGLVMAAAGAAAYGAHQLALDEPLLQAVAGILCAAALIVVAEVVERAGFARDEDRPTLGPSWEVRGAWALLYSLAGLFLCGTPLLLSIGHTLTEALVFLTTMAGLAIAAGTVMRLRS